MRLKEGAMIELQRERFARLDCRLFVADCLQVVCRLFVVRDPYRDFSNISMLFLLHFRSLKKNVQPTDGQTDGQTDPHIKMRGRI